MEQDVRPHTTEYPAKAANDQDDIEPEPAQDAEAYSARDTRQGEIIINTPLRKRIFFGGLIAIPILVIIIAGISIANS